MISKLVYCLNDQTAVSNRAAGSVAIRARESASTRRKRAVQTALGRSRLGDGDFSCCRTVLGFLGVQWALIDQAFCGSE